MAIVKKLIESKKLIIDVLDLIKEQKKSLFLLFVLTFISTGLNMVYPYVYKLIIDTLTQLTIKNTIVNDILKTLLLIAIGYFFIQMLGGFLKSYKEYLWQKTKVYLFSSITKKTYNFLLYQDSSFHENQSTGTLIQKVRKGVSQLLELIRMYVQWALASIISILFGILLITITSWEIGLIIIIATIPYLYFLLKISMIIENGEKKRANAYEDENKLYIEGITNIPLIKAYSQEEFEQKKLVKKHRQIIMHTVKMEKQTLNFWLALDLIANLIYFIIIILGSLKVINGQMTIGTIVMCLSYASIIYENLSYLSIMFYATKLSSVTIKRLVNILKYPKKINDSYSAIDLKNVKGSITLKNISFSYKNKNILKNINLSIKPKECVAFVGPSGAGKSTLSKLLLRFYDVKQGKILIDGVNIKNIKQKSLRENISYVQQDPGIFNGTIIANIKYGNPNAKKNAVIEAAKQANIHDFIMSTPKGYNTLVGERGIKLSGGEKQRISLARAFLKNAPILILDEATSSLDSESEAKIQEALEKLIKNRTTIIIAHRLSTIMKADRIVVIDKGKIIESGKHNELLKKKNGLYAKLFKIQSGALLLK